MHIKEGSHIWKGSFSYNPEQEGDTEPVPFELYVEVKESRFEGVSYDDEFREYHDKLPKVNGYFEEDTIHFVVTYPVSFSINDMDEIEVDATKKGHEVIYSGAYSSNNSKWMGIWEIMPLEEEENGVMVYQDYSFGEWELFFLEN